MDMGSDIKRAADDLVTSYEKRIEVVEEAAVTFCNLLEKEWAEGDGMPEEAREKYVAACRSIGMVPYLAR